MSITKYTFADDLRSNERRYYSGMGAEYCDQPVCLCVCESVCPRAYLWNCWTDRHEISCADPLSSWLVRHPAALRYTLCTSGYMDDVTFGRNGRDAKRRRLTGSATAICGVAIPGRSLMSMKCLFSFVTS